ncbi:MAG: hypothetical protein P9L97_13515 [Candidatus Tenebribacter davisii]|nr:hypothetical protein [Candidatus Tenebribacter davisii]
MKKILTISFLITLLVGCSIFNKNAKQPKNKGDDIRKEMIRESITQNIEEKRSDNDIYFGEGIANIDNDYGLAQMSAKERALQDLAQKIQVLIKSDVEKTILNREEYSDGKYSEEFTEVLESKISIYTDQMLTDLQGYKNYSDFPKDGLITYTVWVSKESYEKKVRQDLFNKKNMIIETINTGNNHFGKEEYISAINNWINAHELIKTLFGTNTLKGIIEENDEVLVVYLKDRINSLFSNIMLNLVEDGFSYDNNGVLNKIPKVYVQYVDDDNIKHNFANLPLKATFIEGDGNIEEKFVTGFYGEIEIPVKAIDASNKTIQLKVEIDKNEIDNINIFSLPPLNTMKIKMHKLKTIATSIMFKNNGNNISPDSFKNSINSILLSKGFSTTEKNVNIKDLNDDILNQINTTNADLFLNIYFEITDSNTVGGYDNMFYANCTATLNLYQLPSGRLLQSESFTTQKGFGSTRSNASWDGFSKVQTFVKKYVQNNLTNMGGR